MLSWTPRIRITKKTYLFQLKSFQQNYSLCRMPLGSNSWRFGVGAPAVGNPYDEMQKLPGLPTDQSSMLGLFQVDLFSWYWSIANIGRPNFLRGVILKISRIEAWKSLVAPIKCKEQFLHHVLRSLRRCFGDRCQSQWSPVAKKKTRLVAVLLQDCLGKS